MILWMNWPILRKVSIMFNVLHKIFQSTIFREEPLKLLAVGLNKMPLFVRKVLGPLDDLLFK